MKLKKINEDHYVLEHEDGSTFKVAKKALNKTAQSKIESMAHKFADGGFVPVDVNYKPAPGFIPNAGGVVPVDVNYKPAPGFIPDADFKPDYGDKPKFTGVTRATPQEQMQAARFAPGTADVYKTAVDQPRPVRQAPIQPYMPEQAPGGAEEAMISPIDFITPSMVTAPAKAIAKGAMGAGRELVEAFPRMMASEAGSIGAQKAAPRVNPLGMYSKLEQTLEEKMGGSATPEQIKGMLRDVKPEEMQYSGLNEFLQGKNKVSKQEVLDFVKSNELPVQEKTLGTNRNIFIEENPKNSTYPYAIIDEKGNVLEGFSNRSYAENALKDFVTNPTKFSEYTLPGGENYREKLYTLPGKEIPVKNRGNGVFSYGDYTIYKNEKNGAFDVHDKNGNIVDSATTLDNAKKSADFGMKKESYKSSHWNEPNVLAHTRLNDRIDAEGRKHLFVEEIQSDWHQAGRKQGYAGSEVKIDELPEGYKVEEYKPSLKFGEGEGQKESYWIVTSPEGRRLLTGISSKEEATKRAIDKINRESIETKVPDAPMKKTWHEFVSKNLLNDAAKGGYDNVSWTTGAQQAERYDLSKSVDNVLVKKNGDGTFAIKAQKNGDTLSQNPSVKDSELEDLLGKDLSEKVRSFKGQSETFAGNDLKVGGEGMKGFYDKMIPDYMAKIGKKYGVKPELTDLQAGKPAKAYLQKRENTKDDVFDIYISGDSNSIPQKYGSRIIGKENAQKEIDRLNSEFGSRVNKKVWTMKITPEMRKEILEKGFPLYSVGGVLAGGMLNSEKAEAKDMNYKLIKNEKDHYVMKHPDGSSFKVAKKGLKSDIVNQIESMGQGYAFGGVSKLDEQEPVSSIMPEQTAPDFQQMVQDNPVTPQEAINKQINQAKQDITGRLGAMYSKSGIPQSYDDARIQREAEEKVLADKESQDLARRNESFLFNQEQDKQVAEAQAYNERAAKYGLPLRTVPGQASTLAEATQPQAQDQTQAATVAGEVKAKKPEADIFGQMETAYRTSAKAEQELDTIKQQKYAQAKLDLEAANKAYDDRVQKYTAEANRLQKQIEENPVDANKYFKNSASKISAAIGLMVAGIGAGITKTENAALKVINNAIENDILAQKQNMDQANNLYRENLNRVKDEGVAYNLTKADILGKVELDIKSAASKADSAQQKAALLKNLAEVQMARNAYLQKSALSDVLKLAQTNPKMITPEIAQMLPEEQRVRLVPDVGFAYSKEGAQKVREIKANRDDIVGMVDNLENIRKQSGRELTPSQASSQAQAIGQALIGKLREPVVGPGAMTTDEYKRLQQLIPADVTSVASLDGNILARLQVAKDIVNNSYLNRARTEIINFPTSQAQAQQGQIQTRQGIPYQKVPGGWVPLKTGR